MSMHSYANKIGYCDIIDNLLDKPHTVRAYLGRYFHISKRWSGYRTMKTVNKRVGQFAVSMGYSFIMLGL